jgi:membrane fusion protein (multidrug efflux system)
MTLKNTLVLSLVAIASSALFSCSREGKNADTSAKPASGLLIDAVIVKPRNLERKINVTGTLLANEEVALRSEISGKVTGIFFEEGSAVKKGQLLIKINDNDLQAQLKKTRLQDSLFTKDESRKKQLLALKAISQEEYDMVLTEQQSIRADQQLLQAQIAKTNITAPFDGQIGLRYISEGSFTDPAAVLATMQQINLMKLEFSVPEKYRSYLKPGTEIGFSVVGIDSVFSASVYAVESSIDQSTRSVKVRARSNNQNQMLFPGAFAHVEIVLENVENALVIPAEAVIPELKGQKVFVIKNGKVESVQVEAGIRNESETEITNGLSVGDTLAVTGLLQLRNGSSIEIKSIR